MGSPECVRSSMIWETEDDVEVNIDTVKDEEDWDGGGRKRGVSDTQGSRKRSMSRAGGDQDEYKTRKELHFKQSKKTTEENTLDVLSTWYQDGDAENKLDGADKPGSRGCIQAEEADSNKSTLKSSEDGIDVEKVHGRNHRRRWDEPDNIGKATEYAENSDVKNGKSSDPKIGSVIEREENDTLEVEANDVRISINDKSIKSHEREDEQIDSERTRRGKSEYVEDDDKRISSCDDTFNKERFEEHRQPRNPIRDVKDGNTRVLNDEDCNMWARDKSRRDVENSDASRITEKSGRRQLESDCAEIDYERSAAYRRKDPGKDGSWNDRSKGRDDGWGDGKRDRDNVKDTWKRKQDKETKDNETTYDGMRDWELPRRGRDRIDGRAGSRKDGSRTEAVKTSSKYGISSENYDVIEIQTKPFDYGGEDSRSAFAKTGEVAQQSESKLATDVEEVSHSREDRSRGTHGSGQAGPETKDRFIDGTGAGQEHHSWRDDNDFNAEKSRGLSNRGTGSQSSSGGPAPPSGNQEPGSFNRTPQGGRGNRTGRPGRGRPSGRDGHQTGIPMPLVGSPFGPLGLPPPGPMQSLPPNMSPAPGPISPGVFIPPFQPPIVWPGARGVEINMLGVPPGLPPVPPGPLGPRFSPNLGNGPNGSMGFSPSGPGRGMPSSMSGPHFNVIASVGQGPPLDKASGGWVPPRTNAPPGKAPSRGEQNDYSQNFVDTGMRPQNFIRELELTSVVEDYPKLRELIQKKDEIVSKSASAPMYYKCDLREQLISPEFFGTKFDVILLDPPWEEYVHRAPGVTDHMEYWTFEEIMNLKIEAIADTPSFIFLWVGDGVGLEQGRQCLKKWGFRRCEDICWVKTNKSTATPGLRHDSHTLFQRSKEHCLMGIKGTVRRSTDGHIIHANIDTDVIIAEEPPYGSTAKPEDMYRIIEHFALGRRRLELFGEDHNIRSGWLTVGNGLSSSNFSSEGYTRNFTDEDGKVWVGLGGRNPPPDAPHLVQTTPDIESLRPKSPMKNQQQQQQQLQQSASIPLTMGNSINKRPTTGNSPQNHHNIPNLNPDASTSNITSPAPWMEPQFKPLARDMGPTDEQRMFDVYGYNAGGGGEFMDYEARRGMNML